MRTWLFCVGALLVVSTSASCATAKPDRFVVKTRYGDVTADSTSAMVFRNAMVQPLVVASNRLMVVSTIELKDIDVVLVQQPQGAGCQGRFVFVTISATEAKATPAFGTCVDEQAKPMLEHDEITFEMSNQDGKGTTRFFYQNGEVHASGEPLK
jgi:hypothetical protein